MSISELMTALQARGIVLQAVGSRIDFQAPAGAMTSELLHHMAANKPQLLAELRDLAQTEPAEELRQAIRQARDWPDLSGILDRGQVAFERGEVSRDQAEELAALAAQVAHELPEAVNPAADSDTVQVWAEDLLDDSTTATDTCPNCGQAQWWDKAGRRTCQVCHPEPRRKAVLVT